MRRIGIVALARKLLAAFWRYVDAGSCRREPCSRRLRREVESWAKIAVGSIMPIAASWCGRREFRSPPGSGRAFGRTQHRAWARRTPRIEGRTTEQRLNGTPARVVSGFVQSRVLRMSCPQGAEALLGA
jgi:hypothetical protein